MKTFRNFNCQRRTARRFGKTSRKIEEGGGEPAPEPGYKRTHNGEILFAEISPLASIYIISVKIGAKTIHFPRGFIYLLPAAAGVAPFARTKWQRNSVFTVVFCSFTISRFAVFKLAGFNREARTLERIRMNRWRSQKGSFRVDFQVLDDITQTAIK